MPDIVDRVYLVDDRSADATVERVREYAATDPRVQLIVHEQNGGVGRAISPGRRRRWPTRSTWSR